MITLVAIDETEVCLSNEAARFSPYIKDAFWDEDSLVGDHTLDVLFATGNQLQILKRVLEAKVYDGGAASFLPCKGTILIGTMVFEAPPFVRIRWTPALEKVLHSLNEAEIVDLPSVANDMTMWDLRAGVACLMLHKIVTGQMYFTAFFEKESRLKEVIYAIYKEQIITTRGPHTADP